MDEALKTKTIKQVADELGTNKQAVRRSMSRCGISAPPVSGVIRLTEPQYKAIFSDFKARQRVASVPEQMSQLDTSIVSVLQEQISLLQEQLTIKDQQIASLSDALVAAQQTAAAAQALHAGTIQQQLTVESTPPRRRWPWQRKEN